MEELINRLGQHAAETAMEMVGDTAENFQRHDKTKQNNNVKQIIINQNIEIMESIINHVTLNDVRMCLDKLELNSKLFIEEGFLISSLSDSDSFPVDLVYVFKIEEPWFKMQAFAQEYSISANESEKTITKAYMKANAYNDYCRYGRAYLDQNFEKESFIFIFEENLVQDKAVSFDFLFDNVRIFMASAYQFYKDYVFDNYKK